jgi:glycosyltransferase involved in cell wall biosynthesis
MRVAHVLLDPRGGGGTYVDSLVRGAERAGWASDVIAPDSRAEANLPLRLPAGSLRALSRADVVNFHGLRSAFLGAWLRRRGCVTTTHGLHLLRARGRGRTLGGRAATRLAISGSSRVICVSSADLQTLVDAVPAARTRVELVRSGVRPRGLLGADERDRIRLELGIAIDAPLVLFVGNLQSVKDPELAVEAALTARESVPELVLVLAGDGPLMGLVARNASEGVRVLGRRSDVDQLLGAADVVLNTSQWEGLPLSVLESLWCGTPVVAVDVEGNREAVGDAGVLVSPRSASAIAEALVGVFSTPEVRARLARAARTRAESMFDEREMVEATLEIYERVAREGPHP